MAPPVAKHPAFARAQAIDARVPAPRVKVLPPSAFEIGYRTRNKLAGPVSVGLRCLSAEESSAASELGIAEAQRADLDTEDERHEAYNAAAMRHLLAVALVDPLDVSKPYFKSAANDMVRVAFTPATMLVLTQEYDALCIAESPSSPMIDEPTALDLAERLASDFDTMTPRARRLAAELHAEMTATNAEG